MESFAQLLHEHTQQCNNEAPRLLFPVAKKTHQELVAWASQEQWRNLGDDLQGACAIGASMLFYRLQEVGLAARIGVGSTERSEHFFILCLDHVVDITARQFGYQHVEVRTQSQADKALLEWQCSRTLNSPEELYAYQKQNQWFKSQTIPSAWKTQEGFISDQGRASDKTQIVRSVRPKG